MLPMHEPLVEQRQHTRYHVEFPLSFEGDHEGTGTVYNLGLGGCKVASEVQTKTGDILKVTLHIPDMPPVIIHAGAVRWSVDGEFGVDFLGVKESERDRLADYLNQLA